MSPEAQRQSLPAGYQLDDYRIEQVIGTGGFGITYLARHAENGERLAVKEYMPLEFAERAEDGVAIGPANEEKRPAYDAGLERFAEEAGTIVSLDHPSIVPVRRFIRRNGTAYLIMDFQDGESLAAILAREKTLEEDAINRIVFPVIDGLDEIHRKGFLHRDIKPGNIMVRRDGTPVLLDFGAARPVVLEAEGKPSTVVSPGYTAPEQYHGEGREGPWTDIYGLGAVMYRAISGSHPPDAKERAAEDLMTPAVDAGLLRYDANFLRAIDCALALDHRDRPDNAADFKEMLEGRREVKISGAWDDPADVRRFWKVAAGLLAALAVGLYLVLGSGEKDTGRRVLADGHETESSVGRIFQDCEDCPLMVVVPPGQTMIGEESGHGRQADFERPFAIGVYEVTRGQFAAFATETGRDMSGGCTLRMERGAWRRDPNLGWRRPGFPQTALHPVVCVSWRDAEAYALWLSRKTGRRYRLPSEAEWRHAARGGGTTRFTWGDRFEPALANCDGCGGAAEERATVPVGSFPANGFGLHDVHGNVAEWTLDCLHADRRGIPADGGPVLEGECEKRVALGGHWADRPAALRFSVSRAYLIDQRNVRLGFRVVRELD